MTNRGANYNREKNKDRDLTLLIGMCGGIASDGVLTDGEIAFLRTWLAGHDNIASEWPADNIRILLSTALESGEISESDRGELLSMLSHVSRNEFSSTGSAEAADIEGAVFPDDPAPDSFEDKFFCFTGNFAGLTKEDCKRFTERLGGVVQRDVTRETNYLVVAASAHPDWKHGAIGTKGIRALKLRKESGMPRIIREQVWVAAADAAWNKKG